MKLFTSEFFLSHHVPPIGQDKWTPREMNRMVEACNWWAEKKAGQLEKALRGVLALIESGYLVRDVTNDADPDWVMKQLMPVEALRLAVCVLEELNEKGK